MKESKHFFFAKKKQKTSINLDHAGDNADGKSKFFWFFLFTKRTAYLPGSFA
jgi:hypothetical protein